MPRELSTEEEDIAFEYAIKGKSLALTAEVLGFSSDMAFYKYRLSHPIFDKELKSVRVAACDILEDDMLSAVDEYANPHQARVKIEAIKHVLGYRKPEIYGQRIDLNVNQTVSIKSNIDAANDRLTSLMRDVIEIPSSITKLIE